MSDGRAEFSNRKYRSGEERLQPYKVRTLEFAQNDPKGLILDIGSGSGVISQILHNSGWRVVGLDISYEGMRKYCRKNLLGLIADAERGFPFSDQSFDAVWISEVMEHVVDYIGLIKEIHRILKPEGRVYVTTPNSVFYGYRAMYLLGKAPTELQHPFHLRFFSFRFLRNIFLENGFKVDRVVGQNVYFVLPVSIIQMMSKISQRLSGCFVKLLRDAGFQLCEGLIHGDKYIYSRFSSKLVSLLSNAIILVVSKRRGAGAAGISKSGS